MNQYLDKTGLQQVWNKIVANFPHLDQENGVVLAKYLPSYVDDVLEYDSKTAFPSTGETGKIYVAKDTNIIYRWSGTQYTEISSTLALGKTAQTAYTGSDGVLNREAVEKMAGVEISGGSANVKEKADKDSFASQKDVTPVSIVDGVWTVYKNDGSTQAKTVSGNSCTIEFGYKAKFSGKYLWTTNTAYANPTKTSGNWGSTGLPASGVKSAEYTSAVLASNTTISQSISYTKAPAAKVQNGYVVLETTGSDSTKSASASLSFNYAVFSGVLTKSTVTAADFASLTAGYTTSKAATKSGVTAKAGEYYVYAYPSAWGDLTKIIQNGATPVLDGFVKSTVSYTNGAGYTQNYTVYTSANDGAFTGASLQFS